MIAKLTPNSITTPDDSQVELEPLSSGLYIVRNCYDGNYEYFSGRPLENSSPTDNPESES